jgi:hypothetical protein
MIYFGMVLLLESWIKQVQRKQFVILRFDQEQEPASLPDLPLNENSEETRYSVHENKMRAMIPLHSCWGNLPDYPEQGRAKSMNATNFVP